MPEAAKVAAGPETQAPSRRQAAPLSSNSWPEARPPLGGNIPHTYVRERYRRHTEQPFRSSNCGTSQGHSSGEGSDAIRAHRSQWRGGKNRDENAPDQVIDLRQSQRRNAADAGGAEQRHRPASQDSGVGRCESKSLDFLQQPGLPQSAPRIAGRADGEYCGGGNAGRASRGLGNANSGTANFFWSCTCSATVSNPLCCNSAM